MRVLSGLTRKGMTATLLALTIVLIAGVWLLAPERHTITVTGLGEPITFVTTEQRLGQALLEKGLSVQANDAVEPALTTELRGQKEWQVNVRVAVPVSLVVAGEPQEVQSSALTVKAMLDQLGIQMGEQDLVSVPLDTPIAAGLKVEVTRRSEQIVTVREEVPFNTVKHEDATLLIGETSVVQEGVAGVVEVTRKIQLENGREIATEVLAEKVITQPVDQIVAYGTLGVVSRGGREYRYTAELDMTATGYTAGKESNPNGTGHTYTGMKAVRGVVAVDPRVIPLYTRLYVEGYGPAIAADIGGAVKGNKIDLCFDTVAEALEWGIRPVKVYVLSD